MWTWRRPFPPAHPRSRGENRPPVRSRASWAGSSPLTRGKLGDDISLDRPHGLIPAHAGKTTHSVKETPAHRVHPRSRGETDQAPVGSRTTWAHPHSRGENETCAPERCPPYGSSPLTRGKRLGQEEVAGVQGLIPAHAGKTATRPPPPSSPTAHPHSHGENKWSPPTTPGPAGSSPLTRGKLEDAVARAVGKGLIPTHAGKTRAGRLAT